MRPRAHGVAGDSTLPPVELPDPLKPRMRGVLHQWGFLVALVAGGLLVALADRGLPRLSAAIYAAGLAGLLGTSALYHRGRWSPRARRWMRRLDHAMIFVLIAATATPVALLVLDGTLRVALLAAMWGGALGGLVLNLLWPAAPRWVGALASVLVGWSSLAAVPPLAREALGALVLLAIGGLVYSAGALVYALGRPNPWPRTFGFHEVFHTLVLTAAALHFVAIALVIDAAS